MTPRPPTTMAWAESLTTHQLINHLRGLVQHDHYTEQASDALVLEAANRLLKLHETLHLHRPADVQ